MKLSYTSIIITLAFLFLCSLSFWQLQRGLEKQGLIKNTTQQSKLPAISLAELSNLSKLSARILAKDHNSQYFNHRNIKLQGNFEKQPTILVDNQISAGQIGYHVLTPFSIAPSKTVLINRGWIPIGASRHIAPSIEPILNTSVPSDHTTDHTDYTGQSKTNAQPSHYNQTTLITGQIYFPQKNRFVKNKLESNPFDGPLSSTAAKHVSPIIRVQEMDITLLQPFFKTELLPILIHLSPDSLLSLEAIPEKAIWLNPQKHFAYAIQWLLLALSLLIIYTIVSRSQNQDQNQGQNPKNTNL